MSINNKYNVCLILIAISLAIGFASCSTDDGKSYQQGQQEYIQKTFESMKGSYAGTLEMPDNSSRTVKFSIDKQANFKIPSFPMEQILYKVYGGDYLSVQQSADAVSFDCPIDSVGFTGGYMTIVTKNNLVANRIDFSYTKGEEKHEGYALLTVKGLYNPSNRILVTNFIVTELVIDRKDHTSDLCPIDHVIEATQQD